MWEQMIACAKENGWKGGAFKKLNVLFETKLLGQDAEIRARMSKRVEDFVYNMLVNVFSAGDSADFAKDILLKANSYDLGAKAERIEDPAEWTKEQIIAKAAELDTDKGPEGDFDD